MNSDNTNSEGGVPITGCGGGGGAVGCGVAFCRCRYDCDSTN